MMNGSIAALLAAALIASACGSANGETAAGDAERPGVAPAAPIEADEPAVEPVAPEPGDRSDAPVADEPAPESRPAAERPAPSPAAGAGVSGHEPAQSAPAPTPEQQAAQASAEEILRRAEQVYSAMQTMEADFTQHLTVPLLNTTQRSEGRMYQKRPDRFLMRFTDPAGDIIVADGQHFWMYQPSVDQTQVLRSRMTEGGATMDFQREFISNPTRRYVATLAGSEAVGGRDAHLISLVPRGASPYRLIRVWVDKQDHTIRRFEMTEENESVRRIELRNLRRNVDLADSLFRFTPPAGTQVFDQ